MTQISLRAADYLIKGLTDFCQKCPSGVLVEIGVYRGESTEIFAKSGKFNQIFAIDPWLNGYDSRDSVSVKGDMNAAETAFDAVMARHNQIVKIKQTSKEAALTCHSVLANVVYIDACHTYEAVQS